MVASHLFRWRRPARGPAEAGDADFLQAEALLMGDAHHDDHLGPPRERPRPRPVSRQHDRIAGAVDPDIFIRQQPSASSDFDRPVSGVNVDRKRWMIFPMHPTERVGVADLCGPAGRAGWATGRPRLRSPVPDDHVADGALAAVTAGSLLSGRRTTSLATPISGFTAADDAGS